MKKKLKLLVITFDFQNYIVQDFYFLLNELSKLADVTVWHEPGNIHEILENLNKDFDFIFVNDYGEMLTPKITGLDSLKVPFGVKVHDLHYEVEERKRLLEQNNVKYIFSHYRDPFHYFYPEFTDRLYWWPSCVNLDLFKDYRLPKDIDMLMMGAIYEDIYPLRRKIIATLDGREEFIYHSHPGYRNFDKDKKELVFENYAKEINRSKLFFTCDSVFKYPVTKYYQVPASNTLLLAPSSDEVRDLGFISGVHFVEINENDFEQKAYYYLNNKEERDKIAEQGYEMVRKKHSTQKRAGELLDYIRKILNSKI